MIHQSIEGAQRPHRLIASTYHGDSTSTAGRQAQIDHAQQYEADQPSSDTKNFDWSAIAFPIPCPPIKNTTQTTFQPNSGYRESAQYTFRSKQSYSPYAVSDSRVQSKVPLACDLQSGFQSTQFTTSHVFNPNSSPIVPFGLDHYGFSSLSDSFTPELAFSYQHPAVYGNQHPSPSISTLSWVQLPLGNPSAQTSNTSSPAEGSVSYQSIDQWNLGSLA